MGRKSYLGGSTLLSFAHYARDALRESGPNSEEGELAIKRAAYKNRAAAAGKKITHGMLAAFEARFRAAQKSALNRTQLNVAAEARRDAERERYEKTTPSPQLVKRRPKPRGSK